MKNKISFSCFLLCFVIGYSQNKKDSISSLQTFESFMYSKTQKSNDFNPFIYSEKLKKQLSPYILKIDGINIDKMYSLSSNNYYFEDYYTIYKNDLDRFIPQPPDITEFFSFK